MKDTNIQWMQWPPGFTEAADLLVIRKEEESGSLKEMLSGIMKPKTAI